MVRTLSKTDKCLSEMDGFTKISSGPGLDQVMYVIIDELRSQIFALTTRVAAQDEIIKDSTKEQLVAASF